MKIIGTTTIHPFFFFSGKIAGYMAWIVFILAALDMIEVERNPIESLMVFSIILSAIGLLLVVISLFNLGDSTSLGLPSEKTVFKEKGLYRLSRNPMYLGFNLLTLSACLFTANGLILAIGIYSIVVYHFIIISEEAFLLKRFDQEYALYTKNVRRYI